MNRKVVYRLTADQRLPILSPGQSEEGEAGGDITAGQAISLEMVDN